MASTGPSRKRQRKPAQPVRRIVHDAQNDIDGTQSGGAAQNAASVAASSNREETKNAAKQIITLLSQIQQPATLLYKQVMSLPTPKVPAQGVMQSLGIYIKYQIASETDATFELTDGDGDLVATGLLAEIFDRGLTTASDSMVAFVRLLTQRHLGLEARQIVGEPYQQDTILCELLLSVTNSILDIDIGLELPVLPRKRLHRDLRQVVKLLIEDPESEISSADFASLSSKFHPDDLYLSSKAPATSLPSGNTLLLPDVGLPSLRKYQEAAVKWMLHKEGQQDSESSVIVRSSQLSLWRPVGNEVWFNPYTGALRSAQPPDVSFSHIRGGILADEMGLGKTVEVLACVASHPRPSVANEENLGTFIANSHINEENGSRVTDNDDVVACLCESDMDDDLGWVQCDTCGAWLHIRCTGYNKTAGDSFHCLICKCTRMTVTSRATLIITPASIASQWMLEIERHTRPGSFSVGIYLGVKDILGKKKGITTTDKWRALDPVAMANHDIVLTTYEALRADIYHADLGREQKSMRKRKRYRPVPTPLLGIDWWRVCLDEAQMIETTTAKAAEMALRLQSQIRWCVSGTPIKSGLDDLFGLLVFLRAYPFDVKSLWDRALKLPFLSGRTEPLLNLLRALMWRNNKADVLDQIYLPPQTQEIHYVHFTSIEAHFYRKQEEECFRAVSELISKRRDTSNEWISTSSIASLLRLRQACCHPQIGNFGLRSNHNQLMSLDEILQQLLTKARVECEEAQRQLVGALNGLAAICMIEGLPKQAAATYREAIGIIDENASLFRVDDIQKIHIYSNLANVLTTLEVEYGVKTLSELPPIYAHPVSTLPVVDVPDREEEIEIGTANETEVSASTITSLSTASSISSPTLQLSKEVGKLRQEANKLRSRYIGAACLKQDIAMKKLLDMSSVIEEKTKDKTASAWYITALAQLEEEEGSHQVNDLIERIRRDLYSKVTGDEFLSIAGRFRNPTGLRYVLVSELSNVQQTRDKALKVMKELSQMPNSMQIEESGNCGKCRAGKTGKECFQCLAKPAINDYESAIHLFRRKHRQVNFNTLAEEEEAAAAAAATAGILTDSADGAGLAGNVSNAFKEDAEFIQILRNLQRMLRSLSNPHDLLRQSAHHLEIFEDMQRELKLCSQLWLAQHERLSALDEVDMALTTIRLRLPDEDVPENERGYKLLPAEVADKKLDLNSDRIISAVTLDRAKGQLQYLRNVWATRNGNNGVVICAVCHDAVARESIVFPCAHVFCYGCVKLLIDHSRATKNVKCPTCRHQAQISSLSHVLDLPAGASQTSLRGQFGTKIDALISKLLDIRNRYGLETKAVVFSQWDDMLKLVSTALTSTGVRHEWVHGKKSYETALHAFRTDREVSVLLLPIRSGANGLNLTEATHILMLEPVLSPGVMAQAINRIHRIGQTKPTFVHRLITKGTIEERIFELEQRRAENQNALPVSEGGLSPRASSAWHAPQKENDGVTVSDLATLFGVAGQRASA